MNGFKEVKTIRQAIDAMAQVHPETAFLISPYTGATVRFQELKQQSILLASMLHHAGLKKGDKVAIMMDNGLLTAQLFLGSIYGGYVAVPLNVRAGAAQLSYMLDHCDAKVVFVEDQYIRLLREAAAEVRRDIRVITASADGPLPAFEAHADGLNGLITEPLTGDDVALLMYSSGSTGKPKGAIHTHSSILAHGRNSIEGHQLSATDRSLLVLPLYHINAECVTLIPTLLSGGSVVVAHRFDVSRFWDWIDDLHITWSALVPTIISELVDWDDPGKDRRQAAFQRIRFFRSSSAPLSPTLHRQFLDKFDLPLLQAMGSTEGGNVFSNPVPPGKNKIGSPGLPWGFETRIVDREGTDVPRGESGEVLLRGAGMMQGYYKDSEGTVAVLDSDGWLHTGDLARQDEDGYFFVVGRSKELIIKGGVNIAPRQIDEVLESHPAVLEAAAVGVPDRYLGEDAVAFVVLRPEVAADERELLAFCETRLGHFKTPSRIHFLKELPKGPSGKVQRLKLLDPAILASVMAASQPVNGSAEIDANIHHNLDKDLSSVNSIEQIIATAWAEILGMPQVGYDTNFFALGGHSLLAIQCLSELREKLPIILSLADFFEFSTVSELAGLVRRRLRAANRPSAGELAGSSENWEQALLQQYVPVKDEVIPHVDSSRPRPLSQAQQRLWFMEQMNPEVPVYNEAEAARLTGELNVGALERALNQIVARHELLRSTIQMIEGVPHAVVHESWPLRFKEIDLSALAPANQQAEVDRLLIEESRVRYDLEAEPGIRVTLLRLGQREHVIILMMHHIICDWSSEGIIWRELSLLYRSFLTAKATMLPTSPVTHGDYAAWKQQQLAENTFADSLAFWEKTLQGAPALLELPADRPRPPIMSFQGDRLLWKLDSTLTEALRNTSRQEKTSLFTIFAAGLDILLYRYTGTDDILLGIPLADRDLPELQSVIGFLLHVHVLRARISGDMTFRQLLSQVQKAALDMYMHRSVPFDQIVRKLHPERNLSYTPLFQVMLNWRDRDQQLSFIGLEGLSIQPLMAAADTSKFDLLFYVTDCGEEIWLELEYNTDLFDQDRIMRMLGHYQTLLEAVANDPCMSIAKVPLLTAKEHEQKEYWNHTESSAPQGKCFDELFREQVERTPDATALIFEGDHRSYGELAERTDHLAAYLQDLGVGRNTLVAICVERSMDMVIGLLGILKAGGAYFPLDPAFPPERLTFMLQDAQPFVLLTQSGLRSLFRSVQIQSVCLDTLPSTLHGLPAPLVGRQSEDLAYVLYTSGSTGTPKGVQIQHRALVNFLISMQREPGITAHDTLLALTTLSFDIAGLELYLPLTVGAAVVIAPSETTKDGRELIALMNASGATIMQATPATWRLLLDSGWRGNPGLKILCGGEAWGIELANELLPRCESLWNMYGPTETTIWSSVCRVEKDQPVLIGTPIANTTFYVLDGSGQPVPVGIPGELYIGGEGLAKGYIWRNDLTSERFLPDSFRPQTDARMYKTGDLVRQVSDGKLEFLRRVDHQVKLRGFRIELGEIEAALEQNVGIHQCVVTVQGDDHAEKRLVAYIVPTDPQVVPKVDELRGSLKSRLPSYMIPAAFMFVERMPLTPNGKIDRKALPGLTANLAVSRSASEVIDVPFTPIELRVKALWDSILGVRTLSVHSNFFESGGHSLLAVSLAAAIQETFHVSISLRTLFLAPTIQEQAKVITELAGNSAHDHIVPLQEGDSSKPAFFLIHSYHLYPLLPRRLGKDLPVYGIQEHSTHDQLGDWTLESLMARYVEAIRSVRPYGPYFIGGFCSAAIPAFEVARQLRDSGEIVALLTIIDSEGNDLQGEIPQNGGEPGRSRLDNARGIWRFHVSRIKSLSVSEVVRYLRDFAATQIKNMTMKLERWWWSRICRFYMRRHLRMPARLLGKLIAGIRIVTLEAVRNYSLKPFDVDIAVFLTSEAALRNPENFVSPWAQTTSGKTEVIWLPGDHTTAFTLPKIDIFAQELRKVLDTAFESHRMSPDSATETGQSEFDSHEPHPSETVGTVR